MLIGVCKPLSSAPAHERDQLLVEPRHVVAESAEDDHVRERRRDVRQVPEVIR
jgi:hypothetical protein